MALIQFNAKLYPEAVAEFNKLFEESGEQTKGKFIELLLENFTNPRVKDKDMAARHQADCDHYQNKISELTDRILNIEQEKIQSEACAIDMTEKCQRLLNEKNELTVLMDQKTLQANQIVITMEPYVKYFVDEVLKQYEKRGKPTTAGPMLLNLFWNYILRGAGDYLPVIFDTGYVKSVLERFRKEKIMREEAAENGN